MMEPIYVSIFVRAFSGVSLAVSIINLLSVKLSFTDFGYIKWIQNP